MSEYWNKFGQPFPKYAHYLAVMLRLRADRQARKAAAIDALLKRKLSNLDIAIKYGVSVRTVKRWRAQLGIGKG